jgi:hypothetical protein
MTEGISEAASVNADTRRFARPEERIARACQHSVDSKFLNQQLACAEQLKVGRCQYH